MFDKKEYNKKYQRMYRKKILPKHNCYICGKDITGTYRRRFCKECSKSVKAERIKHKKKLRNDYWKSLSQKQQKETILKAMKEIRASI